MSAGNSQNLQAAHAIITFNKSDMLNLQLATELTKKNLNNFVSQTIIYNNNFTQTNNKLKILVESHIN